MRMTCLTGELHSVLQSALSFRTLEFVITHLTFHTFIRRAFVFHFQFRNRNAPIFANREMIPIYYYIRHF